MATLTSPYLLSLRRSFKHAPGTATLDKTRDTCIHHLVIENVIELLQISIPFTIETNNCLREYINVEGITPWDPSKHPMVSVFSKVKKEETNLRKLIREPLHPPQQRGMFRWQVLQSGVSITRTKKTIPRSYHVEIPHSSIRNRLGQQHHWVNLQLMSVTWEQPTEPLCKESHDGLIQESLCPTMTRAYRMMLDVVPMFPLALTKANQTREETSSPPMAGATTPARLIELMLMLAPKDASQPF